MEKLLRATLGLLSILLTTAATAASPIADIEDMKAAAKRGAIIWDVRTAQEYERGHIPGAVNIGDPTKVLRDANTEDFISTHRIAEIFGAAGLDPSREVMVYGKRGAFEAYFGRYTMRYFGNRSVRVYHDGIEGWIEAGQPLSTGRHKSARLDITLQESPEAVATLSDVVRATNDPWNIQLLDVRTRKEFQGEDIRAIRGGHIPTAINIPYQLNWKDPHTPERLARKEVRDNAGMSLKERERLRDLYSMLDPNKETIVYCQSGTRASVTAAILEDLGFKHVKVYDESWLGYAAKLDAPVNNQTFVNVGMLQSQIRALAARLDTLERLGAKDSRLR